MSTTRLVLAALPLALGLTLAVAAAPAPRVLAERLAEAELVRRGSSLEATGPGARWNYESGLFGVALLRLGAATADPRWSRAGSRLAESFVTPRGEILTYAPAKMDLDAIAPGRVLLLNLANGTAAPGTAAAVEHLRQQLRDQGRNAAGGFWHKRKYRDQMWLDGLYMAAPFLAHYGRRENDEAALRDVVLQFRLLDAHTYDPATGLHYHAWDAARTQPWAQPDTGASRVFWSRAIGWAAMALVDTLLHFDPASEDAAFLRDLLQRVAAGVARWQDPATGVWWQVTDQGQRPGNYLESSASCMFVYALAQGIDAGWLDGERFLPVAQRGWQGITSEFLRTDEAGALHLTQCCAVAALGFRNAAGRERDGTYDYYISEPIVENDMKGVGPFILAGVALHQLANAAP